jgi:RND superfamily putative drug exporter
MARRLVVIRVADFCYRQRRLVVAAWVVALIVVILVGGRLPAEHRANYQTPGSESSEAYDLLGDRFPARKDDSIKLVFAGDIADSEVRRSVEAVIATAASQPHVGGVDSPYSADGASRVSENGRVA